MTTTETPNPPDRDETPEWAIPSAGLLDELEAEPVEDDAGATSTVSDDEPSGNSEAAKYRRKLRDVEAERDTLRDRVEALQRTQVEQLAGNLKPAALWSTTHLETLLDDAGNVDAERVNEAVSRARAELGIPSTSMRPDLSEGSSGRGSPSRISWSDALKQGGAR